MVVEHHQETLAEIISIAQTIVNGKKVTVEDLRKVVRLLRRTSYAEDKIFFPIISIEDDFDGYPLGQVRDNYEQKFLTHLDKETEETLIKMQPILIQTCKEIISKYGDKGSKGSG